MIPAHAANVKARVLFVFGTQHRYPEAKVALRGELQDGEDDTRTLAKFHRIPPNFDAIEMDSMVLLEQVEVRNAWARPGGDIAECAVLVGLSKKELSVPTAKRKHGANL